MSYIVSIYQYSVSTDKSLLVARVYCSTASRALSEGAHYAAQYEEEGFPITVKIKSPPLVRK